MAITRAQQYRQMLKEGSVAMQGGVKNYLGKQKTVSDVPVKWQSGKDKPSTELAYITNAEKKLLLKPTILEASWEAYLTECLLNSELHSNLLHQY